MAVYVDNAEHQFGRMKMCHMWADTEQELLAMVDLIGVQRKWIQGHPTLSFGKHRNASWVHFDISKNKRALAVEKGAIETDRYGPVRHIANLCAASSDPWMKASGQIMLERIEHNQRRRERLLETEKEGKHD